MGAARPRERQALTQSHIAGGDRLLIVYYLGKTQGRTGNLNRKEEVSGRSSREKPHWAVLAGGP